MIVENHNIYRKHGISNAFDRLNDFGIYISNLFGKGFCGTVGVENEEVI